MPRRLWFFPLALIGSTLACDSKPPSGPIPVHPVSGRVVYQGKPVADALVVFHRDGGESQPSTPVPTGKTDAEGRFQIHTYANDDGAPTGGYKVTVVVAAASERRDLLAKNSVRASNITLPAKYGDPARSGLTATIKAGDNVIPPYEL